MEKAKMLQRIASVLFSVADDEVLEGDLSPLELCEIVENDSPLNAAFFVYICGMTMGARIERKNPGKADLYHEPEEITAAEYKKRLKEENINLGGHSKQLLDIESKISSAEVMLDKAATMWADVGNDLDLDMEKPTKKGQENYLFSFEDISNKFDIMHDYIRSARDELQKIVI